ncbi:DUF397 domain-containing protein [Nonomuraea sp. NPDC003214]
MEARDLTPTDLSGAEWKKSSRSGNNGGNCVEVATNLPGVIAVRDSKDRSGPVLTFTPSEWSAFIGGVKDGEFDRTA